MNRGFAMPVVLMLTLVVGISAAVMLERQAAQRLATQRQLNQYRDHHFQRGVREVVGEWTNELAGQPIEELLDVDGHAMDVAMADGSWLSVYLFDGQGGLLTEPAGLNAEDRADAIGVLEQLVLLTNGNIQPGWLRAAGPVRVSAASASVEVLTAIATYAAPKGDARRFAESLVEARAQAALTDAEIQTACSAGRIDAEGRQVITRLLGTRPDVWLMVIDVYPAQRSGNGPQTRYGGLFSPPGGSTGRTVSLQSLGKFLTWEELPLQSP